MINFRSIPAFSTSSSHFTTQDPTKRKEAPKIDTETVIALPEEAKEKLVYESQICVPTKVCMINRNYYKDYTYAQLRNNQVLKVS